MGSSDEFVTRYAAVWNETDSGARRKAVADLWAEDGHYANVGQEYRGHEAVAQAIDEAYEDFVSKGFSFTVHSHLKNHDAIRIVWHMVPTGGGDVAAVGTEFITVDAADRILTNYQFMDIDPGQ